MGKTKPPEVPVLCRQCGSANLLYQVTHYKCLDCHQTTGLHTRRRGKGR